MIEYVKGNIFNSNAEAIINPVNTQGVMGKGLAFQFKKLYPSNYELYANACKEFRVDIGNDFIYAKENEKIIVNFPTKTDWRKPSKLEYITKGLNVLKEFIRKENVGSVAIPPIGAGNGKLDWNIVKAEIEKFSKEIDPNVIIYVYEPDEVEFKLNKSHLLILKSILKFYDKGLNKEFLTDLTLQKTLYLTDIYMGKNYFKFSKHIKGPFSKTVTVLYGDLKEYRNIRRLKLRDIEKELEKKLISENVDNEFRCIEKSINLIDSLVRFYNISSVQEMENEIELLSTLLFIIKESPEQIDLYETLVNWGKRKEKYARNETEKMIFFMKENNLISTGLFGYTVNN